ncbi:unnamed protein product, partial [Larinioides sclopetarius]
MCLGFGTAGGRFWIPQYDTRIVIMYRVCFKSSIISSDCSCYAIGSA